MELYKVLHEDGRAFHGGSGTWSLPDGDKPGEWMPLIEHIRPCQSGYHVCEPNDLLRWLGPAIFVVEVRGKSIRHSDKTVVQQARLLSKTPWDGRVAASFALDCAQRALNAEKRAGRTPDKRLYDAIKASRRFLKREATQDEMSAAASAARSAAARSAARSASASAWSAARSAESAAESASAWSAARSAARSAAASAAWSASAAARSAARSAEQRWQRKRLLEYITGKRTI